VLKVLKVLNFSGAGEGNTFTCTFTGDEPHPRVQVRYGFTAHRCCKIMQCMSFDDLAVGG
jgi:hypothetical protein